jgi:von Willebrand factor type A domain
MNSRVFAWLVVFLVTACSADDPEASGRAGAGGSTPQAHSSAAAGGRSGSVSGSGGTAAGWAGNPGIAGAPAEIDGSDAGAVTCAKQTARASRQPVYLEFAFDVSGSMGKGDKPWHDRTLKWDPVVAATRAFFEDDKSQGYSAALTFFPADGGDDTRCMKESYLTPDVPMQALPSKKFGEALDAIGKQDWRGGTPTLYVLQGVLEQIAASQMQNPGRYALVLVTDGYPQDCDDDEIASVAALVKTRAADIPTYVIGVTNPPIDDAPDVTTNLREIAEAGGTGQAYLIDTGNAAQTVADFKQTIDAIRSAAISCKLDVPPAPLGQTFDKKKVSVRYSKRGMTTALGYDSECKAAAAWHYDDPNQPKQIVLCPETCKTLQSDDSVELAVDFECEQVILGPL